MKRVMVVLGGMVFLSLVGCTSNKATEEGTDCDNTCPVGAVPSTTKEAEGTCGVDGNFKKTDLQTEVSGQCVGSGECQVVCLFPVCLATQTLKITATEWLCSGGDPCDAVECSGHGYCRNNNGQPQCKCDAGYNEDGLACVWDGVTDVSVEPEVVDTEIDAFIEN